ncbi:MAG: cysteine desulfurase family protein [Hyphomonadaceae bacterium]
MNARAYCDHNAGSPLRPEAAEAVARAMSVGGNPSSVHAFGRAARKRMEDAREDVARAVGAAPENVVFTSGATEALHLALEAARREAKSLIYSAIEHDALADHAPKVWPGARIAPVTREGAIDLETLAALLAQAEKPALVALMLANNETGAIQPVAQAAALVREAGGLLLVDAAQALGRIPVNIADLDAAYLVVSSHKIGGPQGAGALILAPGAPFQIVRGGGGQERGRRPGTENVPAIAGFGAAANIASRLSEIEKLTRLRDRFERESGAVLIARDAPRLPNTSLFVLPHMRAETAVISFDLAGVAVSAGAACSSGKVRKSRVLEAMGAPAEWQTNSVRASFGWSSTEADVDALLAAFSSIAAREAEVA